MDFLHVPTLTFGVLYCFSSSASGSLDSRASFLKTKLFFLKPCRGTVDILCKHLSPGDESACHFGDWYEVIFGLPHQAALRIGMSVFGAGLYVVAVRRLAILVLPFAPNRPTYNIVGRLPYFAACLFSCAAGALDPLGLKLLFLSTVPAAFGGSSGLLWADGLMPRAAPDLKLVIQRSPLWWIAAAVFGTCYLVFLGRGIESSP